ncbi:MAG: type I methionyl aminopeptidase [Actinobacteria bacterium]|nr:type I methionyl aminopeptidase [Actinomycetota bacterium]
MAIQIKTLEQMKIMRKAGLLVGQTLELLRDSIKVGMRTDALDAIAAASIKRGGGTSNFKGYHGFPATICVSINDEIVHGIPGDRVIEDGDVVSIDCGAIIDGWHGDAAISIGVGNVDLADQKMMDVCDESMWRGIAAGATGARLSDIGHAIEDYIKSQGKYGILQEYGGHGIGTEMHQEPHVLNFGRRGFGPILTEGFVLAIEPMITRGTHKTKVMADNWTVISTDNSRGAHFENSYCLLPDGKAFVLTALDGGKERLGALGVEISTLL